MLSRHVLPTIHKDGAGVGRTRPGGPVSGPLSPVQRCSNAPRLFVAFGGWLARRLFYLVLRLVGRVRFRRVRRPDAAIGQAPAKEFLAPFARMVAGLRASPRSLHSLTPKGGRWEVM